MPAITIKLNDFRYPTLDEMRLVNSEAPVLLKFNYPFVSEKAAIINNLSEVG